MGQTVTWFDSDFLGEVWHSFSSKLIALSHSNALWLATNFGRAIAWQITTFRLENGSFMHLKFSQDLEFLLKQLASQSLTFQEIFSQTSGGFSLMIGLSVLPFLFPMPPGLTSILGSACLFLGLQMAWGRQSPWFPRKIAEWKFPRRLGMQLLQNVKRVTKQLEKIVRPRWLAIAENAYVWKANGICIAWLAILLMLPIPFTNPLPATAILLLAVATLEADGLLICCGYGLTLINTLFFAFIGYALWQAPSLLPNF